MALKAKKTKEAVTEEVQSTPEVVEESTPVEEPKLNEDEILAQKKQEELKESEGADIRRMKQTTALLSSKFNLDNAYAVKNFDDKGKVIKETLEGKDFILTITVKDSEKHNIF